MLLTLVAQVGLRFTDIAREAGVTVENQSGEKTKKYIVEVNGNGAAFFDYDEDGDVDLLVANGSTLAHMAKGGSPEAFLYRNRGDGSFEDVTERAGFRTRGWGMGVCVADVDNDGAQDVSLTAYGPNRLFRNRGDGTFVEIASGAGVDHPLYATGCSFGDYDLDGDPDLYVANYVAFDPEAALDREQAPTCQFMGFAVMCGPRHFRGQQDVLFTNHGDGTFRNATVSAGVDAPGSYGFGVVSSDLNGDGWLDIYVANDSRPNYYFRNTGDGRFVEMGLGAGLALNEEGRQEAGMGVAVGDVDNDGLVDVLVTNFSHETNTLYRGSASGLFTDVTFFAGLGGPSIAALGWGVGLFDLDLDGWRDVFVANGHVYPEVDDAPLGTTWRQKKQLFLNDRGRFREATDEVGGPLLVETSSRGVAFGDIDEDGDVDVFVVNLDEAPSLLRNDFRGRAHWLKLRLVGRKGNRDALGARVVVTTATGAQSAEVSSGGSYLSHNDLRLTFGLGPSERVDRVAIRWPTGETADLEGLMVGRELIVLEGVGLLFEGR